MAAALPWPASETPGGRPALRDFRAAAGAEPKFRWWWPHGLVDSAEIAREVDQIVDAGFGGVEIQDVHHSVTADLDAAGHGWGTSPWLAAVETALRRAKARGLKVDLAIGPSWPAAVPTIVPGDPAAAKELVHTATPFTGGISATVEPCVFVAQIARVVTGSTLDPASVQSVPIVGGQVTASVGDGSWLLFTYQIRGSGQQPEGGPHTVPASYVVDHFSAAGTQAILDCWDALILTPAIRRLLREVPGDLFEDSLELETSATLWTPGLIAEFHRRTGRDLLPYLPIVLQLKGKYLYSYDGETSRHVRDEVNQVFSDLYHEHHLLPLHAFAHRLGRTLRVQPYGLQTDAIRSATLLDVPEGESLGFKNLDDFRVLAAARDMAGHELLSCEAAAYAGGAYSTTWSKVLQTMGSIFAGGVNQAVLHGFAYQEAPGAAWPGFAAFSPYHGSIGYAEAWGPRQPTWAHVPDVAGWFTRTQWVLRRGRARADLAYFRQKGYTSTGIGAPWATNDGIPVGWTHGFVDDASLALPAAVVYGGRLAPGGPGYRALILDGDAFNGKDHAIPARAARRLLAYAKAGLPIVVLGDWSDAHPANLGAGGDEAVVRDQIAQLVTHPSVRVVADQTGIPGALAELGVEPEVTHERSSLMHVHRVDGEIDYYYLANARHAENRVITALDQDVWLTAQSPRSVPVRLDAWTGEVVAVSDFERAADRVRVRVALQPGQSTVIALAPVRLPAAPTRAFADPIPLTAWTLSVDDWQPEGVTTHELPLTELLPWSSIPELADVSGIGRYHTTVDAPAGRGALLDLGKVVDTCRVRVNGRLLPPVDVLRPVADLGPFLRPGTNTIEVEVATTLLNRLRVTSPDVFGIAARQAYGLLGPVQLRWYQ